MIIVRHTHIIKKGEIYQKPKTLMAWSRLKNYVASKTVTSRSLKDMQDLVMEAFDSVSAPESFLRILLIYR